MVLVFRQLTILTKHDIQIQNAEIVSFYHNCCDITQICYGDIKPRNLLTDNGVSITTDLDMVTDRE